MSEYWDPMMPVNPPTPPAGADAVTPDATTEPVGVPGGAGRDPGQGTAIPLPPVGGAPAATAPLPATAPGPWEPTGGYAPTGEQPTVGSGPPTPPGGTWGAGPTGAGEPPYFGWPPPGAAASAPSGPSKSKKRSGLAASLAAVVVVVAVVAGVGLGHAVWPTSSTTSSAAGPSAGAGGGTGSSGSGSSPFGSGGSSPFGSGSTGSGSPSFGSGSSGSSGSTSTGAGAPSDISAIATKVSPGLVDINTNLSYQDEQAAGTGMVLTSTGEVLTNNHVIDGATSISVTDVGNGKTYSASVVGYDRTGDIAVIKLSGASGLQTVTTASEAASVGQAIVGVGNAGGTGGTPSAAGGSITALDQSITASDDGGGNAENLSGLIEINAGIEPGDSGGSLVNSQGQVLGMDTAASSASGYQNVATQAYAIPIGTALSVAKKIGAGQASSTIHIGPTAFLGVGVGSSSGSSGSSGGSGNSANSSGAAVSQVLSGSVAGQAGVVVGDTITGINGTTVSSPADLSNLLEPEHPGDTVQLQWTDQSGQTHNASVTLGSGPPA